MLLVKSDYNPGEEEERNEANRFSVFWFEVADVKSASRNEKSFHFYSDSESFSMKI